MPENGSSAESGAGEYEKSTKSKKINLGTTPFSFVRLVRRDLVACLQAPKEESDLIFWGYR